ncbi:MAG: AtpZ/AtpI family protein [Paracoccaceae bacterium]
MSDPTEKERLARLEERIEQVKKAHAPEKPHQEEHYSQANLAWRMVIELVAGLGIGFGIGYGLDVLLGTLPFLLVLFTLLGFAAGIKTMLRSAAEIQRKQVADAAEDERD